MPSAVVLAATGTLKGGDVFVIVLCALLGFAAIYLLLPRPQRYPPAWGSACAALALALAGWLLIRSGVAGRAETLLFYCFSAVALVAGGLLITQRNPVHAALSFALVVLSTCGLFLLQAAPFLMAATIIVYAGAIIVTFLFVVMLAQQEGSSSADFRSREPVLSCVAGFVLLAALLYVLGSSYGSPAEAPVAQAAAAHPDNVEEQEGPVEEGRRPFPADNTAYLGRTLFTEYLLAVELAGTLLLVATIGAIAIVGRRAEGLR